MLRRPARAILVLACFTAALLAAANAPAGDDDERPAYLIYIDPETGRYTTEDPEADATAGDTISPATPAAAEPRRAESASSWLPVAVVSAAAVALLAVAGRHRFSRRRRAQRAFQAVSKELP